MSASFRAKQFNLCVLGTKIETASSGVIVNTTGAFTFYLPDGNNVTLTLNSGVIHPIPILGYSAGAGTVHAVYSGGGYN